MGNIWNFFKYLDEELYEPVIDSSESASNVRENADNQAIINEFLQYSVSSGDFEDTLRSMLGSLGKHLGCERTYIFEEVREGRVRNTYEWCAPQIASQQADFQYATWQMLAEWKSLFDEGRCMIIEDVEDIREINVSDYSWLKIQGIRTLVVCPLHDSNRLVGFFGITNCPRERIKHLSPLLKTISHYIVECIAQRTESDHAPVCPPADDCETPFQAFIKHNYFDSEAFFRSVAIPEAPYYLYFGDLQRNLYYISDNMRDDFGFTENMVYDLIEKWALRISDSLDRELYYQDLDQLLAQKKDMHSLRYRVTDKNGYTVWVHCRGIIKWSEDKSTALFFSGCVSRLENNFSIDVTTGFLKERAALNEFTLLGAKKSAALVIGFTLNHFTYVNETRGRSAGDKLLKNISNALLKELGGYYTFYRLDGMRFMAVSRKSASSSTSHAVDTIRHIIEAQYSRQRVPTKHAASFGILHFPEDGLLPQEILENTMTLLNSAKLAPELDYSEFSQDVIRKKKDKSELALSLNECVEKGFMGFRVVVQPIVSRDTGKIIGGETLLRWKYNDRDVSPAVFIPLLENSRLILPVGKWVFEQAVSICSKIIHYQPDFLLSFNVSYLQVLDDSFLSFMRQVLAETGVAGKNLMLELTETQFDEMPERLQKFVNACLDMGMKFALDDFGNGFSSLQLLLRYPVDVIKLDRTLMNEIAHSTSNLDFIMSIVYACHRSGKLVCVEGVETKDELSTVQQTDCDMIQGFYFFKPMELEDLYNKIIQ
ncbi:EAL domain-containing protein [Blautia schinkii]|nr:EAL domain-containing protein [Blautia schinkii]